MLRSTTATDCCEAMLRRGWHLSKLAPPSSFPGRGCRRCTLCCAALCSQVLYSKFAFMYLDVKMGDQDYILIREDDVIGIMPRTSERQGGRGGRGAAGGAQGTASRIVGS